MIDPAELLQQRFGFTEFRAGQRQVIDTLLAGRSTAAVFPTGGGKSLCYQLPSLCLEGLTLVVSPLIALMKDQIDALARRDVAACRIDSSLSGDEYRAAMDAVRSGAVRLLYVAPERFNNERFRATLMSLRIALFAIDEAHCISEWGHAFRPDYLKLARFAETCGCERVLALTATATPQVLEDIRREFRIKPEDAVRTGFYRANLQLRMAPVTARQREATLLRRIAEQPRGPTIVYVTQQKTAEDVAIRMARQGLPARAYHAGMKPEQRTAVQEWFMTGADTIVVATIAFGMGIDKANIRYVYHFNMPKSIENYAQEIGRAGRDGERSVCETLACSADLNTLENFVYGDTPEPAAVADLLEDVLGGDQDFDVSVYELANQHDIRDLVVRTLLTYLELDGWLRGGTPIYSIYKFKPLVPSAQILAEFDDERQAFIGRLLATAKKGRTWFSIDLDAAAQSLDEPRQRVVAAFDYLGEKGWLELQSSGVRHRYERLQECEDIPSLAAELHSRCTERERRELQRLDEVVQLVESKTCQSKLLCTHFGETLAGDGCGHCTTCETGPVQMSPRPEQEIDADAWRLVTTARSEEPEVLESARALARFACGVRSPRLTKARLARHPGFGSLKDVPFETVLQQASAD